MRANLMIPFWKPLSISSVAIAPLIVVLPQRRSGRKLRGEREETNLVLLCINAQLAWDCLHPCIRRGASDLIDSSADRRIGQTGVDDVPAKMVKERI